MVRDIIIKITECCRKSVSFGFKFGLPQAKEESMPVEVTITNEQKVRVELHPVTDAGHPVSLDGIPTWEVISGESTVEADADGLAAMLVSSDNPGDTQVLVKADADLGSGVTEVSDVITLHVAGAQAKNLGLSVGTPELK